MNVSFRLDSSDQGGDGVDNNSDDEDSVANATGDQHLPPAAATSAGATSSPMTSKQQGSRRRQSATRQSIVVDVSDKCRQRRRRSWFGSTPIHDQRFQDATDAFRYADLNEDGRLDMEEVGRLLEYLDCPVTNEELLQTFNILDEDGDGEVSRDEFRKWYANFGNQVHKHFRIQSESGQGANWLATSGTTAKFCSRILRWTFRTSFTLLTLSTFIVFQVIIFIYTGFLYWFAKGLPECVGEDSIAFVDMYQLSWTTLSTVGYGVICPDLTEAVFGARCVFFEVLLAFESYMGVLFAGIIGALIFGKVARAQSIAQVRFASPMCVRYGNGVLEEGEEETNDNSGESAEEEEIRFPCPVLEFRIVNLLANESGGELLDASVHVVASVLAKVHALEDEEFKNRMKTKKNLSLNSTGLLGTKTRTNGASGTVFQRINHFFTHDQHDIPCESETVDVDAAVNRRKKAKTEAEIEKEVEALIQQRLSDKSNLITMPEIEARRTAVTVDEGHASLVPPQTYHKLEIESDTHVFFKRAWIVRHVLDETSPLLSPKCRRMIANNDGYWPKELRNSQAVRNCINFHEIIVSFSGTANASGSSAYSQHVYNFRSLNIGYEYANMIAKDGKGRLITDMELINDVTAQRGGGAEPLAVRRAVRLHF